MGLSYSLSAEELCLECHAGHFQDYARCIACHRGMDNTTRKELAHSNLVYGKAAYFLIPESPYTSQGKEIIKKAGCRRCHSIGGKGGGLATSLDVSVNKKPFEWVAKSLREPVDFMPNFRFHQAQLEMVIGALLSFANARHDGSKPQPLAFQVHFRQEEGQSQHAFSKHCGGCHRLLSKANGPLGGGSDAPNLSGLFGGFYPNDPEIGPMNAEKLAEWVKNPRAIKPAASMPPLRLSEQELTEVISALE